jgi:hypothetical protein
MKAVKASEYAGDSDSKGRTIEWRRCSTFEYGDESSFDDLIRPSKK